MSEEDLNAVTTRESQLRLQQPTGKYSSEAFGFIQLFRQVGRSVYGLAILELAWLIAVRLLEGLNPTGVSSVSVPFLPFIGGIDMLDLGFYGMFVVAAAWATVVYALPAVLWLRAAATYFLIFIAVLLAPVLAVLNLLLFPVLWATEKFISWRDTKQTRSKLKQRAMKPEEVQELITEIEESHRWVRWALVIPASRFFTRLAIKQPRSRQIALAPFKAFGIFETVSVQIDAREAMQRALLRVQEATPAVQGIKAQPVSTRRPFAARTIVGPQGILLGGRYLDPILPVVTVTYAQTSPRGTVLPKSNHAFSQSLFPEHLEFNRPPITLDLRNAQDIDLVILMSITEMFYHKGGGLEAAGNEVMLEIAARCRAISKPINDATFSAQGQAARLSGAWVGRVISGGSRGGSFAPQFWSVGIPRQACFLLEVIQGCINGGVDVMANLFRLGTIYCLLQDLDAAIKTFELALTGHRLIDPGEGYRALASFSVDLHATSDLEFECARAAAFGFCAIGFGLHERVFEGLKNSWSASVDFHDSYPVGLQAIRQYLIQMDGKYDPFWSGSE